MESNPTPPEQITQVQPPLPTPAPQMVQQQAVNPPAENGGFLDSILKPGMTWKDILISGLLISVSVYGIWYYREKLKALREQPNSDEFDEIRTDVDELMVNVKKALGAKYKTL